MTTEERPASARASEVEPPTRRRPGFAERWRSHLLELFSGDSEGTPAWVRQMGRGTDAGFFGPGSATWVVNGGLTTLPAGIRALLMQTLHPGAMAGVHDWSRYRTDPLGRLSGTVRWITTVTFGDTATARAESDRVNRYHDRVRGTYVDSAGGERDYSAHDADLLAWVHLAFTDAFLGCAEVWGDPIPGGSDAYVGEWAIAGELVGVVDPPRTRAELDARLAGLLERGVLRRDERVDEAVRFLKHPPLSRGMLPAYRILWAGAIASIPAPYRELLGLKRSRLPVVWATGVVLRIVAWVLGGASSSQRLAEQRIAALR